MKGGEGVCINISVFFQASFGEIDLKSDLCLVPRILKLKSEDRFGVPLERKSNRRFSDFFHSRYSTALSFCFLFVFLHGKDHQFAQRPSVLFLYIVDD